jgi:hypothetical protein
VATPDEIGTAVPNASTKVATLMTVDLTVAATGAEEPALTRQRITFVHPSGARR